jgi:hypothetical protein
MSIHEIAELAGVRIGCSTQEDLAKQWGEGKTIIERSKWNNIGQETASDARIETKSDLARLSRRIPQVSAALMVTNGVPAS